MTNLHFNPQSPTLHCCGAEEMAKQSSHISDSDPETVEPNRGGENKRKTLRSASHVFTFPQSLADKPTFSLQTEDGQTWPTDGKLFA